jgi:hypothetical protein
MVSKSAFSFVDSRAAFQANNVLAARSAADFRQLSEKFACSSSGVNH